VATSGAPVAAAEVRATVEVKRPVSVREAAVMTGVPAVAGEVKTVIETKTPLIVPKAALRKDETVDTEPIGTIPLNATAAEVVHDDSRR
jgi:hypothetical protein